MKKKLITFLLIVLSAIFSLTMVACSGGGGNPPVSVWYYLNGMSYEITYENNGEDIVLPSEQELGLTSDQAFSGWFFDAFFTEPFDQAIFKERISRNEPVTVFAKVVKRSDLTGVDIIFDNLSYNATFGGYEGVFSQNPQKPDYLDFYDLYAHVEFAMTADLKVYRDEQLTDIEYFSNFYLNDEFRTYYLQVTNGTESAVYKVRLRYKKRYSVTFMIDNSELNTYYYEEGDLINNTPSLEPAYGYTREWDYDFTLPVNSNVTVNATQPTPLPDGGRYKVEYYVQSAYALDSYTPIFTSDYIYATTDTVITSPSQDVIDAFSTIYEMQDIAEHFEFNPSLTESCTAWYQGYERLVIKFDRKKYRVFFNLNGGTLVSGETEQLVSYGYEAVAPTLEKRGYTFEGFNKTDFTILRDYVNFQPVYNAINYNLTVNLSSYAEYDGQIPSTYTVEDVIYLKSPKKSGYDFIGYTKNGTDIGKNPVISNSIGDITINANYEALFTVTSLSSTATISGLTEYFINNHTALSIPNKIDGKTVSSISANAFGKVKTTLEEVDFSQNTTISQIPSFQGYTALKTVKLNTELREIISYVFKDCSSLLSVTIPENSKLTKIGSVAFYNCPVLETVTIPENSLITEIKDGAFEGCTALKNFNFSNLVNLTTLGADVFKGCSSFTEIDLTATKLTAVYLTTFTGCESVNVVKLPKTINSIANGFLSAFESIETIIIDENNPRYKLVNNILIDKTTDTAISSTSSVSVSANGFTKIGSNAFKGVTVTSLDLTGITEILSSAFDGATLPETITIPSNLRSLGASCFANTSGVTHVNYYSSSVPDKAFYESANLISVTFGNNLSKIGTSAFYGCFKEENLSQKISLVIPSAVTSIGASAFAYATGINEITVPESVTSIGSGAFSYLYNLELVNFNAQAVTSSNKKIFHYSGKDVNGGFAVTFGDKVTKIPAYLFYNDSINAIGNATSVEFSDASKITSIGSYAFANLRKVNEIDLSKFTNLTSIGGYAFLYHLNLKTITIPEKVTSLGNGVFSCCDNVTSVVIDSATFKTSQEYPLGYIFGTYTDKSTRTATTQKTYNNGHSSASYYIPLGLNSVTFNASVVPYGFFSNIKSLKSATLGNKVTALNRFALFNTGVQTVNSYAENLLIGEYAFENAINLTTLNLENGAKISAIEEGAFRGCSAVENVLSENGNGVNILGATVIGANAFRDCASLKLAKVHNAVTIGENAFKDCKNLTTIGLASNPVLEYIGASAFEGCTSLYEMVIPNVFVDYDFVLPSSLKTVEENAFRNTALTTFDGSLATNLEKYLGYGRPLRMRANERIVTHSDMSFATYVEFIGESAGGLEGARQLHEVVLNEGIKTISIRAFYNSTLSEISLPSTLEEIQSYAFAYTELEYITIPASVNYVGSDAWAYSKIKRITFAETDNAVGISDCAFSYAYYLQWLTIPDNYVIYNYKGEEDDEFDFSRVYLYAVQKTSGEFVKPTRSYMENRRYLEPEYLEITEDNFVFYNEPGIDIMFAGFWGDCPQDAVLPKYYNGKPYYIGYYALSYFSELKTVTIPKTVLGFRAFAGYRYMQEPIDIYYEGTVEDWVNMKYPLHEYVFMNVDKLYFNNELAIYLDLTKHDSITNIPARSFAGFNCLEAVRYGENVNLEYYPFDAGNSCTKMAVGTSENVEGNIRVGDYSFARNADGKYILMNYHGTATDLVLPESVNGNPYDIREGFMASNSKITSVVISKGVRKIWYYAFDNCSSLAKITFEEGVTEITNAFYECMALTELIFPDSLVTVSYSFERCFNVDKIRYGKNYVGDYNVCGIVDVMITCNNSLLAEGVEDSYYGFETLHLEGIDVGAYASWTDIDSRFTYLNTIYADKNTVVPYGLSIGTMYFTGTLEEYIESVVKRHFSVGALYLNGERLTSLTINGNVGDYGYYGIGSLESVIINNGVTHVGAHAFENTSLIEVILPDSVVSLGEYAFRTIDRYACQKFVTGNGLTELSGNMIPNHIDLLQLNENLRDFVKDEEQIIDYVIYSPEESRFAWVTDAKELVIDRELEQYYDNHTFKSLKNLKTLIIRNAYGVYIDGLETVETIIFEDAFTDDIYISNCPNLKSVLVGKNVWSVDIENCNSLTNVEFASGNTNLTMSYRIQIKECSSFKTLRLPDCMEEVNVYRFIWDCKTIEEIYVPATVKELYGISVETYNLKAVYFADATNFTYKENGNPVDLHCEYKNATLKGTILKTEIA